MRDLRLLSASVDEKTYILDASVWRSGGWGLENRTGEGPVEMLNREGYMCCLGQLAFQRGVSQKNLLGFHNPVQVAVGEGRQYDENFVDPITKFHTPLARYAITINDDAGRGVGLRIADLKDLFNRNGLRVLVINAEEWGFVDEI